MSVEIIKKEKIKMSKNNKITEEVLEKEILYDENSDCVETTVDEPEDK